VNPLDPNQLDDFGSNGDTGTSEPAEDLGLASPFLSNIPAADRAVVGRYIKDWDAQVTKKFQSYAERVKPYEALGKVDEITPYVNFARNFQRDPEAVFRLMWNGLQEQYGDQFDSELARILQLEMEEAMSDEYDGEEYEEGEYEEGGYDPNEVFQQNVVEELGSFRQFMEEYQESQLRAEEDQQLDGVLAAMHNAYGDFDEDWILQRISVHGNVQKAYQEWQGMLGRYGGGQGSPRQAPRVMGGQGGVPSNNIDPNKLRGKDRRQMVANILEAAQEQ
jgi:hypothetical protein